MISQTLLLDFAESKLHEMIQDKDTTATIFYLKTKEKTCYIERNEIDHNGQISIISRKKNVWFMSSSFNGNKPSVSTEGFFILC